MNTASTAAAGDVNALSGRWPVARRAAPAAGLVAALFGAAVTPVASAQTSVSVYGQANLALSHLDDGGDYAALNLGSNNSRLGFRATHEFSADLRAIAQLEGQVDFDSNENRSLTSRDSFLGLEGSWGLLRGGFFDTASKRLRNSVDLFGNQPGDARNVLRGNYGGNQGFDERWKNGIAYRTPAWNNLTVDLHYSVDTLASGSSEDGNDNQAVSASLSYRVDGLYAAIGHERYSFTDSAREREVTRLAVSRDLGPWRLNGLYQHATDPDDTTWGFGVRYAINPRFALKTQYYRLDADSGLLDAQLFAAGVDWQYHPSLLFYVNYAQVANGDAQTLAPWRQGGTLSARAGAAGEIARALAFGTSFRF